MTSPEKHTERIAWVDTAKAIAIFCVILGHSGIYKIGKVMDSFHMPLFFILAGFFITSSIKKKNFKDFFINRFWRLIVPGVIIIWLILIPCNYLAINVIAKGPLVYIPKNYFVGALTGLRMEWTYQTHLWFLPCMFVASVLTYIIWKHTKTPYLWAIIISFCGFTYCNLINTSLPFSIDLACVAVGFIAFGIYIKDKLKLLSWKTAILLLLIFVTSVYFNSDDIVGWSIGKFGNVCAYIAASISGSLLVIYIARKMPHYRLISFCGSASLIIYCIHFIFVFGNNTIIRLINTENIFWHSLATFIFAIVIMLACIPCVKIMRRFTPWMIGEWKPKKN